MNSYHKPTVDATDQQIRALNLKAEVDDQDVMRVFINHRAGGGLTADEVYLQLLNESLPLLQRMSLVKAIDYGRVLDKNVRRSITNLVRKWGKLEKTNFVRMGSHGRNNHVYQIVKNPDN